MDPRPMPPEWPVCFASIHLGTGFAIADDLLYQSLSLGFIATHFLSAEQNVHLFGAQVGQLMQVGNELPGYMYKHYSLFLGTSIIVIICPQFLDNIQIFIG